MEERMAAEKARLGEPESESSPAERVRVTDRRRFNLDDTADNQEADAAGRGAETPRPKPTFVEELEARTRVAEQKAADVQARFEQLRAELQRETDETRQRLNRAADERASREKAGLVAALLPVVDNLRRAMDAASAGGALDALMNGLRGTVSGFENALTGAGVEIFEVVAGQAFDPERHEAVDVAEVEPERDGQVTAQYSRGYRLGGQLLRPARVQVGRSSVGGGAARGAQ